MNGCVDVSKARSFTRSAVILSMGFEGSHLAIGSGVIANAFDGNRYLITAWHNLSGKRPETGLPLSGNGGLPNQLRIEGCGVDFSANLYAGDNNPNSDPPLYSTHPSGPEIDVTVFRIPHGVRVDYPLDNSFLHPNLNSALPLHVGQTCYILGFPEGLIHRPIENVAFALWKTGNIASEPLFDFEGQPKLLIDATTRRGMSGAMVMVSEGIRNRFVGIYSGRYKQPITATDDDIERDRRFTAELGWVFRSDLVNELIAAITGN